MGSRYGYQRGNLYSGGGFEGRFSSIGCNPTVRSADWRPVSGSICGGERHRVAAWDLVTGRAVQASVLLAKEYKKELVDCVLFSDQ